MHHIDVIILCITDKLSQFYVLGVILLILPTSLTYYIDEILNEVTIFETSYFFLHILVIYHSITIRTHRFFKSLCNMDNIYKKL